MVRLQFEEKGSSRKVTFREEDILGKAQKASDEYHDRQTGLPHRDGSAISANRD